MGACCGILSSPSVKDEVTITSTNKTSPNLSVDVTEVRVSNAENRTKSISNTSPVGRTSIDAPHRSHITLNDSSANMRPNPLVSQMKVKRTFSMDDDVDELPKDHQNDPDRAILANQLSIAHNLSKLNRRHSRDSPIEGIVEALYDMRDQKVPSPTLELPTVPLPAETTVA